VRKLRFFQPDAYVSIDYASQEAEVWRLVRGDGRPTIAGGRLDVPREEPLKLEMLDFVDAVRERRAPLVDAGQGRRALALAERVAAAIGRS
jgi:predicted dehydrogenase